LRRSSIAGAFRANFTDDDIKDWLASPPPPPPPRFSMRRPSVKADGTPLDRFAETGERALSEKRQSVIHQPRSEFTDDDIAQWYLNPPPPPPAPFAARRPSVKADGKPLERFAETGDRALHEKRQSLIHQPRSEFTDEDIAQWYLNPPPPPPAPTVFRRA